MTAPATTRGSLASVLGAFGSGARSVADIAVRAGLRADLVQVALHQLVAPGLLTSDSTSTACPAGGCGGCAAATGRGCASASTRGGLVTLSLAPPRASVSPRDTA